MTQTQASPPPDSFTGRFDSLRRAQKAKKGVPVYTRCVNRPVGRLIAAASPPAVSPNGLTAVGAVLTYGAIVFLGLFATVSPTAALVGVALAVGFFFDSADGQLARLRRQSSVSGEWLDHVLDAGRIAGLHLATLGFLLRNGFGRPQLVIALCGVYVMAAVAMFAGSLLFEKLVVVDGPSGAPALPSWKRSVAMLPVDYGVICLYFLLLPWPSLFVVVYVVGAAAQLGAMSLLFRKWFGTLRQIDRARAEGRGAPLR